MAIEYKDLLGPNGEENNMGGTEQIVYLIRKSDVKTYPAPAAAPANKYVMNTPYVLNTGKKAMQLYTTEDMSELDLGSNGEADGKSFKPMLKLFYPGIDEDAIQFINDVKNDKVNMLVPLNNGKIIQLGSGKHFMTVSPEMKTGTVSGRGLGTFIEISGFVPNILFYSAAVPLTPAP
ncbi:MULTISPECIES: hypothetical protein [Spirosoma]|uniref:Uncharacterized protein n=1 Tax=Spirosoma sordidisoli TaxID=2502893 RepID=A0A4Q2UQ75_9BACT|nr:MULTISPECIES: hypothetical protein [Spirosoma]RYC69790.1 hypothetical protein EQG79_14440 [Spirosoma sordidisoli]